jgi:hypothetical protein
MREIKVVVQKLVGHLHKSGKTTMNEVINIMTTVKQVMTRVMVGMPQVMACLT